MPGGVGPLEGHALTHAKTLPKRREVFGQFGDLTITLTDTLTKATAALSARPLQLPGWAVSLGYPIS